MTIFSATEDIGRHLASTLEPGSQTEINLDTMSMLVIKKRMGEEDKEVTRWRPGGGVSVELPVMTKTSNTVSVSFTNYNNLGHLMSDHSKGDYIRSSVLAVNIVDDDGDSDQEHKSLTKPVQMTLSHPPLSTDKERHCSYWSFSSSNWQNDGCQPIMNISTSNTTVCQVCFISESVVKSEFVFLSQTYLL